MIDNWKRNNWLQPSWSASKTGGRGPCYSFADFVAARLMLEWQQKGADIKAIRAVVKWIQRTKCKGIDEKPFLVWTGKGTPKLFRRDERLPTPDTTMIVCNIGQSYETIKVLLTKHLAAQARKQQREGVTA